MRKKSYYVKGSGKTGRINGTKKEVVLPKNVEEYYKGVRVEELLSKSIPRP